MNLSQSGKDLRQEQKIEVSPLEKWITRRQRFYHLALILFLGMIMVGAVVGFWVN